MRDTRSLFSTAFDGEEQISNSDRMDDEEQTGPISVNIVLPKKLQTIGFLRRLIGAAPTEDSMTNRKNPAVPPSACTISHEKRT
jgi:hypothetical protein